MVDFAQYTKENAPEASRQTLSEVEEKFSFIPNIIRQLAESPSAVEGTVRLMNQLDQTTLTVEERWITLLVVAYQNIANYCVAANSTFAEMQEVPAHIIKGVRSGSPLTDPKLEALRLLATELVRERGHTSSKTIQQFFNAGYNKAQLMEVIMAVGLETIASYTVRTLNTPVDEQYQANIWHQPENASLATA